MRFRLKKCPVLFKYKKKGMKFILPLQFLKKENSFLPFAFLYFDI